MDQEIAELPETVAKSLQEFVTAAEKALGSDLRAIVLYGSAAEGKLEHSPNKRHFAFTESHLLCDNTDYVNHIHLHTQSIL